GLVNDPVQGEQIGYIALPDTAAATLQAAELGLARPDRPGRLPGGEVAGFPEPAQLRAERDPRRRPPAARVGERPGAGPAGRRAIPCLIRDHRSSGRVTAALVKLARMRHKTM